MSPKKICFKKIKGRGQRHFIWVIVTITECIAFQVQVLNAIVNKTFKDDIQSVTLTDYVEETNRPPQDKFYKENCLNKKKMTELINQ